MTNQECADGTFLALCIWREARGESEAARVGVAMAVLNRVARPSWWGRNICQVLFKKWQFSSLTDPRDPQLTKWPDDSDRSWQECLEIARQAIAGERVNYLPGADSYYDISLDEIGKPPAWIESARFVGQLGRLKFYDVDRDFELKHGGSNE